MKNPNMLVSGSLRGRCTAGLPSAVGDHNDKHPGEATEVSAMGTSALRRSEGFSSTGRDGALLQS